VSIAVRVGVATIIVLAGAFTLASAGEPSTNLIPLKEGNTGSTKVTLDGLPQPLQERIILTIYIMLRFVGRHE